MPKHPRHSRGSDRDRDRDRDRQRHHEEDRHEFEHDEGNRAHIEIEERRFRGGLPPTPALYEQARQQWNQLPGAVKGSAKRPEKNKPPVDSDAKPVVDKDEKEGSR
jgi:hypothetical protein